MSMLPCGKTTAAKASRTITLAKVTAQRHEAITATLLQFVNAYPTDFEMHLFVLSTARRRLSFWCCFISLFSLKIISVNKKNMKMSSKMKVYIRDQTHTVASTLREALETENPDEFVSCAVLHPLDTHIVVNAPSIAHVRRALLTVKQKISDARLHTHEQSQKLTGSG